MLFVHVAVCVVHLAPTRLRVDGSDWTTGSPNAFALSASASPTFTWAPMITTNGQAQSAFEITVTEAMGDRNLVWHQVVTSARPWFRWPSLAPRFRPATTYEWTVVTHDDQGEVSPASEAGRFHVADDDWSSVAWLGSDQHNVYRADFGVPAGASTIMLYICGLGYSAVTVNGAPVPNLTLATAPWTNNARLNGFSSLDIMALLVSNARGNQTVGVELGEGWRGNIFNNKDGDVSAAGTIKRVLRAKVVATLPDGSMKTLTQTGDSAWVASTGATTYDNVYNGETYDARLARTKRLHGWATPTFAGRHLWEAPAVLGGVDAPAGAMVPWSAPRVMVRDVRAPIAVASPRPNLYVVDFGANIAGVCELRKVVCPAGTSITLRHAEIMQHAGLPDLHNQSDPAMIYTGNLRGAKATDVYICSGAAEGETWSPKLTYHGFRFVEVNISAPVAFAATNIALLHFHSALEQRTHANFSSATLNRMQKMALGAQRSNFMTVLSDPPHATRQTPYARPYATRLTPHIAHRTPHATCYTPHTTRLTPDTSQLRPHTVHH